MLYKFSYQTIDQVIYVILTLKQLNQQSINTRTANYSYYNETKQLCYTIRLT